MSFSTIIPCFNREKFIAATIDSVLAQEEPGEIIVVDDGSTDRSVEIVRGYGERVRVLRQENRGPGAARNLGAKVASGEYLCFLDSDDVWFAWTLRTFRRVVEMHGGPAVVAGEPVAFGEEKELARVREEPLEVVRHADFLAAQPAWFQPSGMAVRRDVFESAGGFTEAHCEDADLWLRLGVARGVSAVVRPACFGYRIHAGGISNFRPVKAEMERLIDEEIAGRYPGGSERAAERRGYIAMHIRGTSLYCLKQGMVGRAMHLYRRTFWWQVFAGKWKYVLSMPVLGGLRLFKRSGVSA